jgi:hypothetical protein
LGSAEVGIAVVVCSHAVLEAAVSTRAENSSPGFGGNALAMDRRLE